jgi:hypothetical protein
MANPSGKGEEGRRPGAAEIAAALDPGETARGRKKGRRRGTDRRGRRVSGIREKRKGWQGSGPLRERGGGLLGR